MTTIKVRLRPSAVPGREGSIYYRIAHGRTVRQVGTSYRLYASEWSEAAGAAIPPAEGERVGKVRAVGAAVRGETALLMNIVGELRAKGCPFSPDDVVMIFRERLCRHSVCRHVARVARLLRQAGRVRTSDTYVAALRSFTHFLGGGDVALSELNEEIVMRYQQWLQGQGVGMNTISFYMRVLRAAYNRALREGLATRGAAAPFRNAYTGIARTLKRAVPIEDIRRIKQLPLPVGSSDDWARDMFLFSFYTRGMSFVDMASLRKSDLCGGMLAYHRSKTKQTLYIRWESCMEAIVQKYPAPASPWLLPILRGKGDELKKYSNAIHLVNRRLKNIGRLAGVTTTLTMYVARHTWATVARNSCVPVPVISEGMGHTSERTTRIYLSSIENDVIDRANQKILGLL